MATDMGRGIMAPDSNDPISTTGVNEMRTLGATTASAISSLDTQVQGELAERVRKDEAEQYGFEGPEGPAGPPGPPGEGEPGPQGPGGSIALEETDPGCFADSEITWLQWDETGTAASAWNPETQAYHPLIAGVDIDGIFDTLEDLQTAHPSGEVGDAYLVAGDIYLWGDSQWVFAGPLRGPQGPPGETPQPGAWQPITLVNGYSAGNTPPRWRETPIGLQFTGQIDIRQATSTIMFYLPTPPVAIIDDLVLVTDSTVGSVRFHTNGEARLTGWDTITHAFIRLANIMPTD